MITKKHHTIQYFFLATIILLLTTACTNKKHERSRSEAEASKVNIEEKKNSTSKDTVKAANLEDIPFIMPKNWTYRKFTDELKQSWKNPNSGLVGIAADPLDARFSVTVWEYKVDTLEQLLLLFKSDMEALNVTVNYEIKNGAVYGLTKQASETDFKWKGRNIKEGDKQKFIAVGSFAEIYDENQEFLGSIFNSIGSK